MLENDPIQLALLKKVYFFSGCDVHVSNHELLLLFQTFGNKLMIACQSQSHHLHHQLHF